MPSPFSPSSHLLASALLIFAASGSYSESRPAPKQATDSALVNEARSLVNAFGGELKSTLISAMQHGGPIKAIEVCQLQAGPIAKKLGTQSDWQVARTALKVRNTNNTADHWERETLDQFELRKAKGENPKHMEHAERITENGQTVFRYMKAIPTGGLCLNCHGETVDQKVKQKLVTLYPNDQATGFKLGDIRGAFSLQTTLSEH